MYLYGKGKVGTKKFHVSSSQLLEGVVERLIFK